MNECNNQQSIPNLARKSKKDFSYARRNKKWQDLQYLDLVYRKTVTRKGKDTDYMPFISAIYQGLRNERFHRDTFKIWLVLRRKTQQVRKSVLFRSKYCGVRIY
jgi:hypothetical protein